MRGKAAIIPVGFAVAFGIINGYSIFQPLVVEERLRTLQAKGVPEVAPLKTSLEKKSEADQSANSNERAVKGLEKPKADTKPVG